MVSHVTPQLVSDTNRGLGLFGLLGVGSITQSPDYQITQSRNSLLIPCFRALKSRKPAIHAAFRQPQKKFRVIFPVIGKSSTVQQWHCQFFWLWLVTGSRPTTRGFA
jgi:hypothetical protein